MVNSPQVSTTLTVEAWVYPMTMAEADAVILRRFTQNLADPFLTYSLHLHRNSSSELPTAVFSISSGIPGSVTSVSSNQTAIPFFKWTHVAATFDGSSMKIYVDGGLANQTPATLAIPSSGEIRLGLSIAPQTSSTFVGFIDEVQHWNIVRTQSEIQGSMRGIQSPSFMPGLIGYWKFEEDASARRRSSITAQRETTGNIGRELIQNNSAPLISQVLPQYRLTPWFWISASLRKAKQHSDRLQSVTPGLVH